MNARLRYSKYFLVLLLLLGGLRHSIATVAADDGLEDCLCGSSNSVYGSVEGLLLGRDSRGQQPIVIAIQDEGNALPGTTLLTASDLRFDWEGGLRAMIGWRRDESSAWELGYFGVFDWNATASLTGNNNLAIPGDLGQASLDFFAADQIDVSYQSQLHGAEINYVSGCDLAWLVGFRYVSLNEDFDLRGTDFDTGTSDYFVRATNNLFGGQLGTRLVAHRGAWSWEATAKAGLYGNAANQSQFVADFPPGFFLRSRVGDAGGSVAFLGDLNLTGSYHINSTWSLRAGYNLLWIEGVALASQQLDFTDTATSGTTLDFGGLFAHGLNLGLEARW